MDLRNLHPLEIKVLLHFMSSASAPARPPQILSADLLCSELHFNTGQANQALSWLAARSLISENQRKTLTYYELTALGETYKRNGTPAERIITLLKERGAAALPRIAELLGLENRDVGSAFGQLSKQGALSMDDHKQVVLRDESCAIDLIKTRAILNRTKSATHYNMDDLSPDERGILARIGKKRGASTAVFRIIEREEVLYTFTDDAVKTHDALRDEGISGEEITALTAKMLKEGSWKGAHFRPYAIQLPPSRLYAGRKNPYSEYLDWVRDKLVALGFEEFDGPLVESEFWNSDALFMPQFHAARDIHDVYYVKDPLYAKEIEQPWLDNVAAVHENGADTGSRGWGYQFNRDFTRRLILRSQGTVMSAKTLHEARVPGKYFGILRCFRYDQVDATHLSDFYQTEGIVLGESVSLRTLLGLLKMFATEIAGASAVKYVPGYFPFTEPSVEVHIEHPTLGWFELGGAGIFRPEVTRPMGIEVPVLAWGLGIDRMALMRLGLNDLRELFSMDIEKVRLRCQSRPPSATAQQSAAPPSAESMRHA